jgi:peptide-methionine (S)-S-oxide reductase
LNLPTNSSESVYKEDARRAGSLPKHPETGTNDRFIRYLNRKEQFRGGSMIIIALLLALQGEIHPQGGSMASKEHAVFGAGCFWCVEAVFERIDGVIAVDAGYAGGTVPNPTYEQVCSGKTGHAEVAQITFDPSKVTYEKLLGVFWMAHDPTTMNRQGADVGEQYRSVIFYSDERQKTAAEKSLREAQKEFSSPIVTAIEPLKTFYRAENYHQEYFRNNPNAPYCRFVIKPKLDKLHLK